MVGAEPWLWRDVGEVAGVEVSERRATCLLAKASGLSSWAEESGQARLKGNRLVGSARVVWGEGDTVFGICADDGWLLAWSAEFTLKVWQEREMYNLCLLVFQGTLGVIREDHRLVRNRVKAEAWR